MSKIEMGIQEILDYLPHRPPFLLIDRVKDVKPGESLVAIKNVTINEWFFTGHFPGKPIMPGVLILESLAQAAAVLAFRSLSERPKKNGLYLFAAIENVRFRRIVQPGDQLILNVKILNFRKNAMKVFGTAMVGDEVVCTAELVSIRKEEE